MSKPASQTAQQVQDTANTYVHQARETVMDLEQRAETCIAENPTSSVMVAFGLGFGVGIALGAMLVDAVRPRREPAGTFEELGRKVSEYAAQVMPTSWRQ